MHKRSNEPFVWLLFSAGGVVAALLIPIQLFLFGVAFPLGWLNAPSYDSVLALAGSPIGRAYLFVLCMLPLFHWAHRFRYTLYDGLQIKHLDELVNTLCYGGAIVGTIIAGYLIWRIP
ncbi:MAG TPA: fumarate reductase subunit FrdD [Bryobacteraceae bacterium]|nr:fumarate reductase subunit FrdD [Bryobacteraceae bacterium]HXA66263.1 fumarate reductase subunit FrdD [Bryobacteraceae bacterium]